MPEQEGPSPDGHVVRKITYEELMRPDYVPGDESKRVDDAELAHAQANAAAEHVDEAQRRLGKAFERHAAYHRDSTGPGLTPLVALPQLIMEGRHYKKAKEAGDKANEAEENA